MGRSSSSDLHEKPASRAPRRGSLENALGEGPPSIHHSGGGLEQVAVVVPEASVVAHQFGVLRQALRDKHPVEGIAVVKREVLQEDGIRCREVQKLEPKLLSAGDWVVVEAQLVEGSLDHDLGYRD